MGELITGKLSSKRGIVLLALVSPVSILYLISEQSWTEFDLRGGVWPPLDFDFILRTWHQTDVWEARSLFLGKCWMSAYAWNS
jgi:hypothetical protein